MKCELHDMPEEDGMNLMLDMENGLALTIFLSEDAAEDLASMIYNKLNGRLNR